MEHGANQFTEDSCVYDVDDSRLGIDTLIFRLRVGCMIVTRGGYMYVLPMIFFSVFRLSNSNLRDAPTQTEEVVLNIVSYRCK